MILWIFLLLANLSFIISQRMPECQSSIRFDSFSSQLKARISIPILWARSVLRSEPYFELLLIFTTITGNKSNGQLYLLEDEDAALGRIESDSEDPLIYQVIFPNEATFPVFRNITINGYETCKSTDEKINGDNVKTVKLKHVLLKNDKISNSESKKKPPALEEKSAPVESIAPKEPFGPEETPTTKNPSMFMNIVPLPLQNTMRSTRKPPIASLTTSTPNSNDETNIDEICGRLDPGFLISKGMDYVRGDWPWLVALFMPTVKGIEFNCGGTLISPRFVITAAHCVRNPERSIQNEDFLIFLGLHSLYDIAQRGVEARSVNRLYVHDEYNFTTFYADIAMIELNKEVKYSKYIKPLCIWKYDDDLSLVVDRVGTIAGWGRDERGAPVSKYPNQVNVPIISNDQCRDSHSDFRKHVNDLNFCGGYRNGSSPCSGDSGGGLALRLRDHGRWYLRGIVSYSLREGPYCNTHQYVVFTDAAKFSTWILDKIL